MKKTLVIVAHPQIEQSKVNKCWIEAIAQYPDQFTVHELYQTYPDGKIDVVKEQQLIEDHEHLILQFPVYWFNCPPLMKQWLDEVFTYGWAYGSTGNKLRNKKIMLAVSAGIKEDEFSHTGQYKVTLDQVLKPFELTVEYVKADYQSIYAFYDAENNPLTQDIERSAVDYIQTLMQLRNVA